MRILGIDPGLRLTGYGCIEGVGERPRLVEAGVLRLGEGARRASERAGVSVCGGANPHAGALRVGSGGPHAGALRLRSEAASRGTQSVSSRLWELDRDVSELLERLKPELVAVESLFAHYKHPTTAIVMGHARGVILLAIRRAGIELAEFRPNMVKKSLTGHGHADKGQMQRAVQAQFGLAAAPRPPDVADALAIALCAARRLADGRAQKGIGEGVSVARGGKRRDSVAAARRLGAVVE